MSKSTLKTLQELTSDKGSFKISFNEHKENYCETKKDIRDYYIFEKDEGLDLDYEKDIIEFIWYNNTPTAFYSVYANTFEELEKKILDLMELLKDE